MKKQEYILKQETGDDVEMKYMSAHLGKQEILKALMTIRRERNAMREGLDSISMELGICPENSTLEKVIFRIRELSSNRREA